MDERRQIQAVHTAKEITRLFKAHSRREKRLSEKPVVTVSPDVRNGHGISFQLTVQMPCRLEKKGKKEVVRFPPISVEDQAVIAACVDGDFKREVAPLLAKVGLKNFEVETQKPKEGLKTFRCTLKNTTREE